jgi:hypothetical protein
MYTRGEWSRLNLPAELIAIIVDYLDIDGRLLSGIQPRRLSPTRIEVIQNGITRRNCGPTFGCVYLDLDKEKPAGSGPHYSIFSMSHGKDMIGLVGGGRCQVWEI